MMSVARTVRALSPSPRSTISASSQACHSRKVLRGSPKIRRQIKFSPDTLVNNSKNRNSPCTTGTKIDILCNSTPTITVQLTPDKNLNEDKILDFKSPNDAVFLSPSLFQPTELFVESPISLGSLGNKFLYTPEKETKFLGRGTFGNVTLCQYKDQKYALKIIRKSSSINIGERHLLGIEHPHLVRILKITELRDRVMVCMEFCGHCNLQQVLDSKGDIEFRTQISFAKQVASGLRHCHQSGIVHGDVKPANVIVSPSGHCKLGDFGHSMKKEDGIVCRRSNYLRGTAAYAAPEVLQGSGYSTASDVYSFGITLWQIYTREMPYADEHPHAIIYKVVKQSKRPIFEIPESHQEANYIKLSRNCWNKQPPNRPSVEQVLSTLKCLLQLT